MQQALREHGDFKSSITGTVEAILQSPDFLYRLEFGELDGNGIKRPSGAEMANRLSFFLWGGPPDEQLNEAAANGELSTPNGVMSQAARLLEDPKSRRVVQYFFDNLLPVNGLTDQTRDPESFPTFNAGIGALMAEETTRFLQHAVFEDNGTWDAILTAPYTFVNEELANFYGMPGVTGEEFRKVDVDPSKRLGLLTHASVLTGTTVTNYTNPVRRGGFLLSHILCVDVPLPPDELAALVKPPEPYSGATGRERYSAHSSQEVCRSCHTLLDPPGFAFENYDAVGLWRDTENDVTIDASGELSALGSFSGPLELVQLVSKSELTHKCFTHQWQKFAYGRDLDDKSTDKRSSQQLDQAFASSGHSVKQMLLDITQTDAFSILGSTGIMARTQISRRHLLRGAGTLAVGLPWLEAMLPSEVHAQSTTTAKRFISVYQPGGTVLNKWRPTGSESDFVLSSILEPFAAIQDKLVVVDGVDMKSALGEQHQAGIVALLTGTPQSDTHNQYSGGPSIDQVIAATASQGKARKSLEMAVRWATGKSHGNLHPINSLNFADDDNFSPIPPRIDPVQIWDTVFGTLDPTSDSSTTDMLARKTSILDFLDRRYEGLAQRLGATDRAKLEQHLTQVRELERSLATLAPTEGSTCVAPEKVDTSDYNPASGKNSAMDGSIKDISSDAAIPKVGKFFMDMIVAAFACDITSVSTLQWSDTEAKHTFPWLELSEHHHFYQHDGSFRPAECEQIARWYSEQHAYLISALQAVDMGGHSLLDETVVFFGSELQDPPSHLKNNMPFLLAGNGGGLRTGRYLKYNGASHNDLLLSVLRLFGDDRSIFGDERFCTGELPGLV